MIILKIKKSGHIIDIPGLTTCRTPAEVDISKLDMRSVAMYLKTSDISDYEIVACNKRGEQEVYKKDDFENKTKTKEEEIQTKEFNNRLSKIEEVISILTSQKGRNLNSQKEQIIERLDKIEDLLVNNISHPDIVEIKKEPVIEEFDSFIPDIDIDVSDILSSMIKKR